MYSPTNHPPHTHTKPRLIQRGEELGGSLFVRPLRHCEPAFVHPVVNAVIDPLVHRVNLRAKRLGIQIQLGVPCKLVEARVKVTDDLGRLVADDALRLLIPWRRGDDEDGAARGETFTRRFVKFCRKNKT